MRFRNVLNYIDGNNSISIVEFNSLVLAVNPSAKEEDIMDLVYYFVHIHSIGNSWRIGERRNKFR